MTEQYGYYFETKGKGQLEGPNDPKATHFRDESAETSLTREMIQNALDAHDEDADGPVTVEFELRNFNLSKLRGVSDLAYAARRAHQLHEGAQGASALERAVATLTKAQADGGIPTLRIGDSGTTGLTGSENDFDSPGAKLATLTRADGLSDGDGVRGGSFGIGSSAARIASDLRTVVYVTKPKDKDETVYASITYLAGWRDEENVGRRATGIFTKLGVPGEDVEYLRDVPALEGFSPRTANGTDVYVLGASTFAADPSLVRLRNAAIENFLVAILHERLIVKGLFSAGEWVLDKESLRGYIDTDQRLAEQVLPFYLALTEGELRTGETSKLGKVRMHVLTGVKLTAKYGTMTMRTPLMKIEITRSTLPLNYAAIFICDDPKGNRELRELEPPKHDKWSPKTPDGRSGNQVVYQQVRDFIRDTLKEFVPTYDEAEFVFDGLEDLLPANFDFATQHAPPSDNGNQDTGEPEPEESGVELGKPEHFTDDITPTQGQELEVEQAATASDEADDEAESGTHTGGGKQSHESGGENETQGSEEPPGDSMLRRRDLTFRSFAADKGKATLVIKARRDLKGKLPLFAIGSASSEPIELKSASLVQSDGTLKTLTVEDHTILSVTLAKDDLVRLSVEFARASRYRLGVGNG